MTNFEFYKDEIAKIVASDSSVAIVDEKPCACEEIDCEDCDFNWENCCTAELIKWFYAEHVEKPKINKRTKMFFDAIETGWVARDSNNNLYLYPTDDKPKKYRVDWLGERIIHNVQLFGDIFPFLTLDFIKWEDKEPWSVEDIRNLEVED